MITFFRRLFLKIALKRYDVTILHVNGFNDDEFIHEILRILKETEKERKLKARENKLDIQRRKNES